jgi:hypothetical protein
MLQEVDRYRFKGPSNDYLPGLPDVVYQLDRSRKAGDYGLRESRACRFCSGKSSICCGYSPVTALPLNPEFRIETPLCHVQFDLQFVWLP